MIPRKDIDIGWSDLAQGVRLALRPGSEDAAHRAVLRAWRGSRHAVATLSVRSGLDLALTALAWPAGSRVLMSAVTIRDMERVVRAHGLVPVPLDMDWPTLSVRPADVLRRAGPRARGIVVAHLFGATPPLGGVIRAARRRGLVVFEDCAQAYRGTSFRGDARSDVRLFSFGPLKTSTALGGAVLEFRDPRWRDRVAALQAAWPATTSREYLGKIVKWGGLKGLSHPGVFGAFVRACRIAGIPHDRFLHRATRQFGTQELLVAIRRRPGAALLRMLARRLADSHPPSVAVRVRIAGMLRTTGARLDHPGRRVPAHAHWVYPVVVRDPGRTVAALLDRGVDTTTASDSLVAVAGGRGAPRAAAALSRMLLLPLNRAMTRATIAQVTGAIESTPRP